MCGRTSLAVELDAITSRFSATPTPGVDIPKRYNIAPSQDLAVIQNDTPEEIDTLEWGFIPFWADDPDDVATPINARSETAHEKPMFRDAFAMRRCLVLADGFYEWAGERGSKQPFRVERTDREPYAYAGLWETWSPENGEEQEERVTCTILTCDSNEIVGQVHDRMPVMLEEPDEVAWLNGGDEEELRSVLDPYPDENLHVYPVSKKVDNPENDSPDLLEEVDIGEQSGLSNFEG